MAQLRSACLLLVLLCACSPTLDWRQVRPAGFDLEALFPCRPAALSREMSLLQRRLEMAMYACSAGGSTYAVGTLALDDVRDVGLALAALREAAARNVGGKEIEAKPVQVPGATPHALATRVTIAGKRPDGTKVVEHLAVFAYGNRVFQTIVVGDRPDAQAVSIFFDALRVGRASQ